MERVIFSTNKLVTLPAVQIFSNKYISEALDLNLVFWGGIRC